MGIVEEYQRVDKLPESYWRSIILFGQNSASYKFALGKSLIELARAGKDSVTLNELSIPFSKHLCQHLAHSPKQATNKSSQFLGVCRRYNEGAASYDELIETTTAKGFVNVIDAFHRVNRADVPLRFYEKDYARGHKRIILTDQLFELAESAQGSNLLSETESRWNLVETAWEMGVSTHLLRIDYDDGTKTLSAVDRTKRKNVTSARGALNGYQKGRCFYCFTDIHAGIGSLENGPDVANSPGESADFPYAFPKESHTEYALIDLDEGNVSRSEGGILLPSQQKNHGPRASSRAVSEGVPPLPDADRGPRFPTPKPRITTEEVPLCDVDHYFPHTLMQYIPQVNFDGVWNLVLACPDCNRGPGGKSARVPELKYLERLHRRNEYLISSHHPLRESIMMQTGLTEPDRRRFLIEMDKQAISILVHRWSVEQRAPAVF